MPFAVLSILLALAAFGGFLLFVSRKGAIGPGDHVPWSLVVGFFRLLACMASLSATFNIGNYLSLETKLESPSL
jgi:hypothetical protein